MVKKNSENKTKSLQFYEIALESAQKSNHLEEIVMALANLGFAYIQRLEIESGEAQFSKALQYAQEAQNTNLQVKCLGLKALAYQEIKRLPEAYKAMNEVLELVADTGDAGAKCDALTSQGQILLDSGEPLVALQKLEEARTIANELVDKRRQMNVFGVLGNQSLAVTSLAQAEVYFDKASQLAGELGDTEARFGFLGNRGSVLAWQGHYREAIPDFEQVLDFVREYRDQSAEIQALRHLAQAHSKLKEDENALEYARQGVELCKVNNDETILSFFETIIVAYYRQGKIGDAQVTNQDAISFARTLNNNGKELEFLLSLGETQFLSELHEDALQTYQKALKLAKRLSRRSDEAYLTGRIGVTLAELGHLDDAIQYHSQAVDLARLWLFPRLEGEQLSMLAMAYYDKGDKRQAREYCHLAIQVFSEAGLNEDMQKASHLFKQISA